MWVKGPGLNAVDPRVPFRRPAYYKYPTPTTVRAAKAEASGLRTALINPSTLRSHFRENVSFMLFVKDLHDALKSPCFISPLRLPIFQELIYYFNVIMNEYALRPLHQGHLPIAQAVDILEACLKHLWFLKFF